VNFPATQNRRGHHRYKTLCYTARIRRRGLLGRYLGAREAAVIDFNRHGLALCCDKKYSGGDRLQISMYSRSESLSNIYAVVRYVQRAKGEYRIGAEFINDEESLVQRTDTGKSILAGLERVINRQLA